MSVWAVVKVVCDGVFCEGGGGFCVFIIFWLTGGTVSTDWFGRLGGLFTRGGLVVLFGLGEVD